MGATSSSCGNASCLECQDLYECEVEAEHLAMVERTILGPKLPAWMIEEMSLVTEERQEELKVKKRRAREERRSYRKKERIHRIHSSSMRLEAVALLDARPVRRRFLDQDGGRVEWMGEVWIELEYPTIDVAAKEGVLMLNTRVGKAIQRAEKKMKQKQSKDASLVYDQKIVD